MKVRILTGPHAGETQHVPRSQEIELQIKLGTIEVVPDPVIPPKPPVWGVRRTPLSGTVTLALFCDSCATITNYCGPATDENFASIERQSCSHVKAAGGIPKEARDLYAYSLNGVEPTTASHMFAAGVVGAGGSLQPGRQFRIDPQTGEKIPVA
jgi:hypothetical protein